MVAAIYSDSQSCQIDNSLRVECPHCQHCKGTRLRKDANYVKVYKHSITELVLMPIDELFNFFKKIKLNEREIEIAQRLITEIKSRLQYLNNVGLGYLKLGQSSSTLSGGEAQRLKLASYLVDENKKSFQKTLFIFDEPTSGLHYSDISNFMKSVQKLIDIGNSVIIIEHNIDLIKQADWLIDLGPGGGSGGGEVCFSGYPNKIISKKGNKTGKYLKKAFV